jgi:hypothetical protein
MMSVSRPEIDPDSVDAGVSALLSGTTHWKESSKLGIASPLIVQLPAGSYEVRTWTRTRLGFSYFCDREPESETVNIKAEPTVVLERSFVCTPPGAVRVRTAVTGVDAGWRSRFSSPPSQESATSRSPNTTRSGRPM